MTGLDLHIAPRNTDDRAWAEKIEARRQQAHRFLALDQAAVVASTRRPVKVAPIKRARTATSTVARPERGVNVRPCPECGHPTRSSGIPVARAPGTRQRRGTTCVPCYDRAHPRTPQNGRVGSGVRVSEAEVAAWVAAYTGGQSVRAIALAAGRPAITVRDWLVRVGVKTVGAR